MNNRGSILIALILHSNQHPQILKMDYSMFRFIKSISERVDTKIISYSFNITIQPLILNRPFHFEFGQVNYLQKGIFTKGY